ncbi:MAG: hypothetical protein M1274_14745 [Actinobacteria bacterium]|nr:hypothetical protein [Actinomycetota bacterium]
MDSRRLASPAWQLKGRTQSLAGWLEFNEGRLRFATPTEVLFDVSLLEISQVKFPWYYFGGGMKLQAAGKPFRISFVKPNGAEVLDARVLASFGDPAALSLAASKVTDIHEGRGAGRRWRELLSASTAAA